MSTTAPLVHRPYRGMDDLAMMQALLRDGRRLADDTTMWHPGDLEWWLGVGDPAVDWSERVDLWSRPGEDAIVAWSWFTPPGELDWFITPMLDSEATRSALLDWCEVRSAPGDRLIQVPDRHPWLLALLEARGYQRTEGGYLHHVRSLDAAYDPPLRLPPGFSVRSVDPATDIPARVAVHRAAFAPSRMTEERYRHVVTLPMYRPDLDIVAVAPDGSFASFCIAWFDAETISVEFEPVGTDPRFQRQGLASAVISEGLKRAAALGVGVALVSSAATGEGANRLYRSLGFRHVRATVPYRHVASADGAAA